MPTVRRRNRAAAFGLVDAMVGLLVLLLLAVGFSFTFQSLLGLSRQQADRVKVLWEASDAHPWEAVL